MAALVWAVLCGSLCSSSSVLLVFINEFILCAFLAVPESWIWFLFLCILDWDFWPHFFHSLRTLGVCGFKAFEIKPPVNNALLAATVAVEITAGMEAVEIPPVVVKIDELSLSHLCGHGTVSRYNSFQEQTFGTTSLRMNIWLFIIATCEGIGWFGLRSAYNLSKSSTPILTCIVNSSIAISFCAASTCFRTPCIWKTVGCILIDSLSYLTHCPVRAAVNFSNRQASVRSCVQKVSCVPAICVVLTSAHCFVLVVISFPGFASEGPPVFTSSAVKFLSVSVEVGRHAMRSISCFCISDKRDFSSAKILMTNGDWSFDCISSVIFCNNSFVDVHFASIFFKHSNEQTNCFTASSSSADWSSIVIGLDLYFDFVCFLIHSSSAVMPFSLSHSAIMIIFTISFMWKSRGSSWYATLS